MDNKNIKEILDFIKEQIEKETLSYEPDVELSKEEAKTLLNYITNLQEENKRLEEIIENLTTMTVCGDKKQTKNTAQFKLEQCQSRIDKAIEYINGNEDYFNNYPLINREHLIEILQGEEND